MNHKSLHSVILVPLDTKRQSVMAEKHNNETASVAKYND